MTRQKQTGKKTEKSKVAEPGDLRKNKGYVFLKDAYIPIFR